MNLKLITNQILIFCFLATIIIAQDSKAVKDKLNNLKGEVTKITIATKNGDIVFEGDEAKQLVKKMKSKSLSKIVKSISEDENNLDIDSESKHVIIFKSSDGDRDIIKEFNGTDKVMIFKHSDGDLETIEEGKIIKINVEDENGEKTATVTTKEDGKEKVETFKGKEADEYLEIMEEDGKMKIDLDVDIDSDCENIWIHKNSDKNRIEKDVKISIEDGVKKVTVTTNENGEELVKVYEGDKAEKYLKENNEKHIRNKDKIKDGKKRKKIILKKIIEKE